jgi:hypothetical protein
MKNTSIYKIIIAIFFTLIFAPVKSQNFYDVNTIQEIEIQFSQANWDYILDSLKNSTEDYLMADWVKINGVQYDSAGVKFKGNSSYDSLNAKNPLNISLDKFKSQKHLGYENIKLSNGYGDIAYSGDTLIDGQVTKKLTKTFHGLGWGMDVTSYSIGTEYTYEANGVVYLRYQNQWDTLYNFNAQVGDSWRMAKQPFANVASQNSRLKVIATGTKLINSSTLKYVKVEFVDPQMNPLGFADTIVENIGFIGSYLLPYDMF